MKQIKIIDSTLKTLNQFVKQENHYQSGANQQIFVVNCCRIKKINRTNTTNIVSDNI